MVSVKVLFIVSCLAATASCTYIPAAEAADVSAELIAGHGGGILGRILGSVFKGLVVEGNILFKGVLPDLLSLHIPATLDDVLNVVRVAGDIVGNVVNQLIPGFGSLLSKLISSLTKILICLLGSPGLTGNLLGDHKPGKYNPPLLCDGLKHYAKHFAKNGGSLSSHKWDRVFKKLGLKDINKKIDNLVSKHTDGGDLSLEDSPESVRVVLQNLQKFGRLFKQHKFSKAQITKAFKYVLVIIGAVGNSNKYGSGTKLINVLVPAIDKVLKKNGFPLMSQWKSSMIDQVTDCHHDQAGWAASIDKEIDVNANNDCDGASTDTESQTTEQA